MSKSVTTKTHEELGKQHQYLLDQLTSITNRETIQCFITSSE
jgi:hypothetical protein